MCIYIYIYVYSHIHIYICIYVYTHMHIYIHICTNLWIYTCVSIDLFTSVHMLHMYICTHIQKIHKAIKKKNCKQRDKGVRHLCKVPQ